MNEEFDLDLTYITERIIAMSFPATGMESTYRNSLKDVAKMLKTKHQENYMVNCLHTVFLSLLPLLVAGCIHYSVLSASTIVLVPAPSFNRFNAGRVCGPAPFPSGGILLHFASCPHTYIAFLSLPVTAISSLNCSLLTEQHSLAHEVHAHFLHTISLHLRTGKWLLIFAAIPLLLFPKLSTW